MLQGEFGEIGLDGINGEEVSVFYSRFVFQSICFRGHVESCTFT